MEGELSTVKSANLCWGQRYIWLRYHQLPVADRHEAHIVLKFKLPENLPLPRIRSAFNYLVRRHESLRTTFHLDGPQPQQRVHAPAALPIRQVSTERDGTPSPSEVIESLVTTEFDLAAEWPIRACIITTGGAPKQIVLVLNHLAFDAWSVDELEREIKILGAASGPAALEPIRHQPVDLARFEASEQADEHRRHALGHWHDEIRGLPCDPYGAARRHRDGPPAHGATLTSPAMLEACRRIATRHRVWPSLVHLTIYNLVMAAYTGTGTVVCMAFTGNRESGPYKNTMTCMFTPTLMRVDCADDPPFSQLLRRTAERFEQSRNRANVPYDEIVELISAESFRRGRPVQTGSELNFISQPRRRSGARRSKFAWNAPPAEWARSGTDLSIRISEWRDATAITVNAASTVMDADAVERFLRGYETVLMAHDAPDTDLRVGDVARLIGWPPAEPGERTVRHGSDLVDLDGVERVLALHPGVVSAKVWSHPAGELVAHICARGPLTPAQLRTHFLGHMYDHQPVRCPDRFRVHHGSGSVEGDGLDVGPGATPGGTAWSTESERVLVAAVADANGLGDLDPSRSYPVAGGRVLRIPQVLARLRDAGWHGLTVGHLCSARPLRSIAGLLVPVDTPAAASDA